jgi:hypothetical protein
VAARVRSNKQLATKSGFAQPKGGSMQSNGGLHLPEQMQVVAAHWQNVVSTLQVNLRRFVVHAVSHG